MYVALSKTMMKVLFVRRTVAFLGAEVKLPITICADNDGAIYMTNTSGTSQSTKHMDVRYYFGREYNHSNEVKVIFVKSEETTADVFTKNLSSEVFIKHIGNFMDDYFSNLKHKKDDKNIFFKVEEMNKRKVATDRQDNIEVNYVSIWHVSGKAIGSYVS